ncbi:MAG: hypothetical protein N4A71_05285 [Carboxylicivirga sp.]|nr:hypothetical protein [Carboxylicivirga sp.]
MVDTSSVRAHSEDGTKHIRSYINAVSKKHQSEIDKSNSTIEAACNSKCITLVKDE